MSSFRAFWKSVTDTVQPATPAPSMATASQDVGHASADVQLQQKMEARSKSVWQRVGAMASVMPPDIHLKILQLMGAAANARPRDQAQVFAKVEAVLDKHEQAGARLDALRTKFAKVAAKMPARVKESVPELLKKAESAALGDKTKILNEVEDLIAITLNPTEMWSQPSREFKRLLGRAQDVVNEAIDNDPTLKNDPVGRGALKGGVELGLGAARLVVDPKGTLGEMGSAMKAAYEAEGGGPRGIDSAFNVVNPVFQGLVATHKMLEHIEKDDWEGAAKEAVNIGASMAATAGGAKMAATTGARLLETPVAAGAEAGVSAAGTSSGSKPATGETAPHSEAVATPYGDSPTTKANPPVSSSSSSPASPAVSQPESFADLQSTVDEVSKHGVDPLAETQPDLARADTQPVPVQKSSPADAIPDREPGPGDTIRDTSALPGFPEPQPPAGRPLPAGEFGQAERMTIDQVIQEMQNGNKRVYLSIDKDNTFWRDILGLEGEHPEAYKHAGKIIVDSNVLTPDQLDIFRHFLNDG